MPRCSPGRHNFSGLFEFGWFSLALLLLDMAPMTRSQTRSGASNDHHDDEEVDDEEIDDEELEADERGGRAGKVVRGLLETDDLEGFLEARAR